MPSALPTTRVEPSGNAVGFWERPEEALDRADVLRNRIRRLVRGVRVGRAIRLKRQLDGHDLDVDAMLEAGIALRMRQEPDPRVFRTTSSKHRDLAVLLLLDISASTRDRLASGVSVLEVERLAVAVASAGGCSQPRKLGPLTVAMC